MRRRVTRRLIRIQAVCTWTVVSGGIMFKILLYNFFSCADGQGLRFWRTTFFPADGQDLLEVDRRTRDISGVPKPAVPAKKLCRGCQPAADSQLTRLVQSVWKMLIVVKYYITVDSRYFKLGYLEFCETQSVYLNQKYILTAFSDHNLALEIFLQVQITRSAN